jgi:hypothetical protein
MRQDIEDLRPNDLINIMYRGCAESRDTTPRWIRATIIYSETGTWPLARLTDGQLTEIRPFMVWRSVALAGTTRNAA